MTTQLYLAPAASGKTAYAIELARRASRGLAAEVRVCVASRPQMHAWRQRLAKAGGTLGVRVMTFDELYLACLGLAGENYTLLAEAVQYRLIQEIIATQPLTHYQSLRDLPGFPLVMDSFIKEMKASRVDPEAFLDAVGAMGDPPRLRELGLIYDDYQRRLRDNGWADYLGVGWLAAETLAKEKFSNVGRDWPLLIVDGFDNFTIVQLDLLEILSERVNHLVITMTGDAHRERTRPVYRRFNQTREKLEKHLQVVAEPLPEQKRPSSPVLAHLEAGLFDPEFGRLEGTNRLTMIAAPDKAAEARAALRWLKERLVYDGMKPGALALLARDILPYRPFIVEAAAEFGVPIRLLEGLPLMANPAVAALLDLLRLVLPLGEDQDGWALPRKGVLAAWRSPYFDWANAVLTREEAKPIGIMPEDIEALDTVARFGRVVAGYEQWQEIFEALTARRQLDSPDEEQQLPPNVVSGPDAQALWGKFEDFLKRILPPQGLNLYRTYVEWLENLIGPDPDASDKQSEEKELPITSLSMIEQIRAGDPKLDTAQVMLDVEAMRKMKEILRGLVWAEQDDGQDRRIDFTQFFIELAGAVEAASYESALEVGEEAVLVTSVLRARGVPFRAMALLGLAEGEFPAVLREDPLVREADRQQFSQDHQLDLESSVESHEREFFYETVTSPWESLLLTRPRLSSTGAEWLPSPFWEEIRRLAEVKPIELTTESVPTPAQAASRAELVESLVAYRRSGAGWEWLLAQEPQRWRQLEEAAAIFSKRFAGAATMYDGDLRGQASLFGRHFHQGYGWSPSALEGYQTCGYFFFSGRVLRLESRQEPEEGMNVAQLGSIYHQIFESLYARLDPADRTDPDQLLTTLPAVANAILDRAPEEQGFRATAWWQQTRGEIIENIAHSVQALVELGGHFVPVRFEARFLGKDCLVVHDGPDHFRLHGVVDRIDRDPDGHIRIIDYKTAGPYRYAKRALDKGEKLQLPLYALAARDALGMGEPVEGFYWHISQAKPSDLTLGEYGPETAIDVALSFAWQSIHGARQGDFRPRPPSGGCPSYCPASAFCWQYQPGR